MSQDLFHELYDKWVDSGYLKKLIPSVDRKKDSKPYTICNIQLMTWGENKFKGHGDMRSAKLIHGNKPQKAVIQYDLHGNYINEFCSVNEAGRKTGISIGNICETCKNKRPVAGGYVWKYLI